MVSSPLVSAQWLNQQLNSDTKPVVLDASIEFQIPLEPEKITNGVIPDSMRFDYDTLVCDPDSSLPHMMPSPERFTQLLGDLAINQQSVIVVYDNSGTYASPRAWWMLRSMGIEQVYVLDGGLRAWCEDGFAVAQNYRTCQPIVSSFAPQQQHFITAETVLSQIDQPESHIIDARSLERFSGTTPEPRQGVRSGHIPNSVCLPFGQLLQQHRFKPVSALIPLFEHITVDRNSTLVFSCGSGVTACILALGAYICGYQKISVYDGSWTEWGQRLELPIEV